MRKDLKNIGSEERFTFIAIFKRTGIKNGYKGKLKTVLFENVRKYDTRELVTDHLWFNYTKGFHLANLHEGDEVQFDARVECYEKGYKGYRKDIYIPVSVDYKLSKPTHIINLNTEHKPLNLDIFPYTPETTPSERSKFGQTKDASRHGAKG